ncbi:MAG: ferritin family protein [Solirubrobacteraceae bacterium]
MSTPAPPLKRVEGARNRDDDASRGFFYFTPQKRRASLYEELTIDTQISNDRHLKGGWLTAFEDGRAAHSLGSTEIRVKEWFDWRDPAGLWERPFYQQAAGYAREQESAIAAARQERLFERMSDAWKAFLQTSLQLPAFYEHGLWRALCGAARPALSDLVTHAIVLEAAMKQRQAQDLVVYAMDLESEIGDCSTEAAKARWMEEEAWQPVREIVESVGESGDWMERVIATNLCIEPVLGTLLRREMLLVPASANGDPITPVIISAAQREWLWYRDWTSELVRFCVEDEEHGAANRAVLAKWCAAWDPFVDAAAESIAGELDKVPGARPAEVSIAQVRGERDELQAAVRGAEVAA